MTDQHAENVVFPAFACGDCGRPMNLPPVPDKPGWVDITDAEGWTTPPLRCPACSALNDGTSS